jgi:hypothetical protein
LLNEIIKWSVDFFILYHLIKDEFQDNNTKDPPPHPVDNSPKIYYYNKNPK